MQTKQEKKDKDHEYYLKNKERWQLRQTEEKREYSRQWRKRNKERVSDYNAWWKENNRDKTRAYDASRRELRNQQQVQRQASSGLLRANHAMTTQVYLALKNKKGGRKWESFLGFTMDELAMHLEALFKPGMTWDNYGYVWHIDHNIPKSWVVGDSLECLRVSWSLYNLQPMWAKDNYSKGNRFAGGCENHS